MAVSSATASTFCPSSSRPYVLAAAILASSMGFIDGSVVSIAMPAIRADLDASLADAQWISNAYALTLSALILTGGAAGDRFGLRLTFIAGIAFFAAASVACALAPNAALLIAFRAVQGVGAAIMVPCSLAIIAKAYPKAERGRAIGTWAAASAMTTALGPVVGGFALSAFDDSIWRAIFAINLPLGAVAIWLLTTRVPVVPPGDQWMLDINGGVRAGAGFGLLAYGLTVLTESGNGATPTRSVLAIVAGLAIIAAFALWERRASEPMVDLGLFANRAFSGANVSTFFLYFALSAILFYLPMLLIAGWGVSPAQTGFLFLPLSVFIALLSGIVGKLSDRIGAKLPIAVGSLTVGAAFAALGFVSLAQYHSFWAGIFPMMVVMGLGMALVVSPLSTAVMTVVEDRQTGAASGINNAVSRIAGLIAVAAMGVVTAFGYASALGGFAGKVPEFGVAPQTALDAATDAARIAAGDSAFATVAFFNAGLCALSALVALATVPGAAKMEKRGEMSK